MAQRSKLPVHFYQKYVMPQKPITLWLSKLEVITDSRKILYSIRILIVLLAFLLGYIHTPTEKSDVSKNQVAPSQEANNFIPKKERDSDFLLIEKIQ